MAGLVPAIHALLCRAVQRRWCPAQGRAWRSERRRPALRSFPRKRDSSS